MIYGEQKWGVIVEKAGELLELRAVHERGIFGARVGIALFDTGLAMMHPDFQVQSKVIAFKDFVYGKSGCYDDNGHGTHVAGIAGGTGAASNKRFVGVAPGCHFIIVKILDHQGNGSIEHVLKGIQWVIKNRKKYGIRVANISIGTGKDECLEEESELVQGVNDLWDAGIVVCVAAGNNGPTPGSIGAPGNSRKVITVGASDDKKEVVLNGKNLKNYSGRGPTSNCIKKPDLVAPGGNIISCNGRFSTRGPSLFGTQGNYYIAKSGTSMATPMVTGAVALLLEKYPEMTNREVKIRLKNRAVDLKLPHTEQGWGLLNVKKLLF